MAQIPVQGSLYVDSADLPAVGCRSGLTIRHYQSTKELVTTLPVTNGSSYIFNNIYSVALPDLMAGDILLITSTFEVTNNHNYLTMLGATLGLAAISNAVYPNFIQQLDAPSTIDLQPQQHNLMPRCRQFKIASPITLPYVNLTAYAASSYRVVGDTIRVESGYGHLDVVIISGG